MINTLSVSVLCVCVCMCVVGRNSVWCKWRPLTDIVIKRLKMFRKVYVYDVLRIVITLLVLLVIYGAYGSTIRHCTILCSTPSVILPLLLLEHVIHCHSAGYHFCADNT